MTQQEQQEKRVDDLTNKLITAATVGLLSWNIWTTHQLSITVAVLAEKIASVERIVHP